MVEPDDTAQAKPTDTTKRTSVKPANKSSKRTKAKRSGNKKKQPPIKQELNGSVTATTGTAAAEANPSTALIKRELPAAAVDIAALLTGILETPRPESAISTATSEEENILSLETPPPITPFDTPLDTPYPAELIDTEVSVAEDSGEAAIAPEPEISSPSPETRPVTAPPPEKTAEALTLALPAKRPLTEQRHLQLRALLLLVSLALFLTSSLLLWQDVSAAHLYVSALNPSTGEILAQEDMASGYTRYAGDAIIAPAATQSSVFFGIASSQSASPVQQVVELQQHGTLWQQTKQFSAPLTHGTLSVTAQGNLVIESEHGLEVTTPGGQLLWHITDNQPVRGVHAFQPAFDNNTLYTVKAAAAGEIAAYDLQNGTLRWTANLHDTLNYAPPLLLAGTTLYVAGDHTIFALNSSDGSLLWTAPRAARTLLLSGNGPHQLLIAASADGLLALNANDGSPVWTFHGQVGPMTPAGVLSLTPAQFYQASATNTTIFATGIAWKAPQIQPELWLYALDAATGNVQWSRQLATGTISADAGRVFTPLAASAQHLVILEQQQDNATLTISAFDASTGLLRWQSQFRGISAASSSQLESSNNVLLFIRLQTDSGTALRNMTIARLLLLATMLLSILSLPLLLLYPWRIQKQRYQQALNRLARKQLPPVWKAMRSRHYSRKLPVIVLLVVLIATCGAGYAQLNQAQESISLLDIHSGATRWQHSALPSTEALAANAQGSILSVAAAEDANMHRVQAIGTNGTIRWQTFASAGTFSVPAVPTQPGTLLLALNGHLPLHYAFAPADPAYPPPLDSLFILSLLNRNTGQPFWQSAIVNPGDQQSAAVIGADTHFIYIASLQTNPPADSGAALQLMAVDQSSGLVTWRVFGPLESLNTPRDNGTLLLQGRRILWQVEGAVYAIDSLMGQIAWRRSPGNDDAQTLLREEGQMAETNGLLLVARSKSIYALDAASGNELWTIPLPSSSNPQSISGLSIDGNTLLVYGNGQIEAINLATQHLIWTKKLLTPATHPLGALTHPLGAQFIVHTADLSAHGSQIYVALVASNTSGQILMALDSKTGATLWRFQPSGQAIFTNVSIIQNQGILLTTLCSPATGTQQTCSHEDLYALNVTTGTVNWQITADSISNIQISPDGATILLQKEGSVWQQLWHV